MKWTKFQKREPIDRLFLLTAMALTVWTLAGLLACRTDPTLPLPCKNNRSRRSIVAIGIEAKAFIHQALQMGRIAFRKLWPQAEIRAFAWEQK